MHQVSIHTYSQGGHERLIRYREAAGELQCKTYFLGFYGINVSSIESKKWCKCKWILWRGATAGADSQTDQNTKRPLHERHKQGRRYELWASWLEEGCWDPVWVVDGVGGVQCPTDTASNVLLQRYRLYLMPPSPHRPPAQTPDFRPPALLTPLRRPCTQENHRVLKTDWYSSLDIYLVVGH